MKQIHSILLLLALMGCTKQSLSQGSQKPCNRAVDVDDYKKTLIKEVCISRNYIISRIYTQYRDIDIDGDGLGDFLFNWRKPIRKDGDTTFITAYRQNTDSSYTLLKTFTHLLPVYLESYDYSPKEVPMKKIYECYHYGYPLLDLALDAGMISMDLRIDAASGYTLKYRYDRKKNNWFLFSFQEWIDMPDGSRQSQDKELPEQPESIDEFSYQKYLCPELYEGKQVKRIKKIIYMHYRK